MSVEGHLQALLGCEWGRRVWTPDDKLECDRKAERIVVLHNSGSETEFKLCPEHIERLCQETTPHGEPSGVAYPCAVCGFERTCGDPPGEDCHS